MIVCRDKADTNQILMSILKAANRRRRDIQPALITVRISNTDSQLLDAVHTALRSVDRSNPEGQQDSANYFQMLHQTWRNAPGLREPR